MTTFHLLKDGFHSAVTEGSIALGHAIAGQKDSKVFFVALNTETKNPVSTSIKTPPSFPATGMIELDDKEFTTEAMHYAALSKAGQPILKI